MPSQNISDLPEWATAHRPKHAQESYLATFNHAFDEYQHDEERAFRVAWSAVERDQEKGEDGQWRRK